MSKKASLLNVCTEYEHVQFVGQNGPVSAVFFVCFRQAPYQEKGPRNHSSAKQPQLSNKASISNPEAS